MFRNISSMHYLEHKIIDTFKAIVDKTLQTIDIIA